MRWLIIALFVAASCSSDKASEPVENDDQPAPTPKESAESPAVPAGPTLAELDALCRDRGAAAACTKAATMDGAAEDLAALACFHGDTTKCDTKAPLVDFELTVGGDSLSSEKIKQIYARGVASCIDRKSVTTGSRGAASVGFEISDGVPAKTAIDTDVEGLAVCLGALVARWRFDAPSDSNESVKLAIAFDGTGIASKPAEVTEAEIMEAIDRQVVDLFADDEAIGSSVDDRAPQDIDGVAAEIRETGD